MSKYIVINPDVSENIDGITRENRSSTRANTVTEKSDTLNELQLGSKDPDGKEK